MASNLIEEQIKRLPHRPGVYLMRDSGGNILYVGKAINLHHRVGSYFAAGQKLTPKIERMVAQVADIDYFVASSEQEALILELNLIKQYHPRYNVRLKDDKTFPYLKLGINEVWPRIYVTRRLEQDGGRYFGPFASAGSVRQTMKVLRNIFPLRTCTRDIAGKITRPCLEYHLGRCLAPCTGAVSREEYARVVKEVVLFLEGRQERIVKGLEARMKAASESMDYEKAARLRDQIQAIRQVVEGQQIAAAVRGEQDAVAFVQDKDIAYVQVFFVRRSRIIGRESFLLQGTSHEEPRQVMTGFIEQYYASNPNIPPRLLLQHPVEDALVIEEWLRSRRGGRVKILVPRRGHPKQLMDIVAENSRQGLERLKIRELAAPRSLEAAQEEVQKKLGLKAAPNRMEAYDISNIQGKAAVGSMVVFENGRPKTSHYRRFKIKTVEGANDYAMLQEVLRRRFRRAGEASDAWAITPGLILIDGGRGQLNAAIEVMKETGVSVSIIGLAKENEEIFLPGEKEPLVLEKSSPALQLLQRLRDEAHRFAIGYFTRVHERETFTSILDGIPGIGPRRKRALLRHFGSVPKIRDASVDELSAAAGITRQQAEKIKEYL